jgi:hypothetical protein
MINRRTFVQSAALVGAAPVLANLLLLPSESKSREILNTEPIPSQHTRAYSDKNSAMFKIDGWDWPDIGVDRTELESADRISGTSSDRQPVIRLTQSWRTAWR